MSGFAETNGSWGKLQKTIENVLSCNERMRMRDEKFTTVFVITVTDLIKPKNGAS